MAIRVKLKVVNSLIVAKPSFATHASPTSTILVKGFTNLGGSVAKLDQLIDVIETNDAQTGDTLVYDKTIDKYTVKAGSLDGGVF